MVALNCPKIISCAMASIASRSNPKILMAALFINSSVVPIPKVNFEGTFTLIFCFDKADFSGTSVVIGVKSK